MTVFRQSFTALIGAQLLCLAFGMWAQYRLLVACARSDGAASASAKESGGEAKSESSGQLPGISGAVLLAWLPAVRGFSLIWIGGLQAAAAYLILTRMQGGFARGRQQAQAAAKQQKRDIITTRDAAIFGMAKVTEWRDRGTGHHLERVALYSTCLAKAMRSDARYRGQISFEFADSIGLSSVLHDIGKVGLDDSILNKTGRLTPDERKRMQVHATLGGQCIHEIELRLGTSNFLAMAREIALAHHERWDGGGYPAGLSREQIPLAARIVAVADVYDALSRHRAYKEALTHEECLSVIRAEAGKHFDPHIAYIFLHNESEIEAIAKRYADPVRDQANLHPRHSSGDVAPETNEDAIDPVKEPLVELAQFA